MLPEQLSGLVTLASLLKDLGLLGGFIVFFHLLLTGRIVTRGHIDGLLAEKDAQIADAKAQGAEWKRLALRGANTIEVMTPLVAGRGAVRERP